MRPGPDHRVVVAAAVLDGDRLLAARRTGPAALAGLWELPGGKVEPGEDEVRALARELREELALEVRVGDRVPGEWELDGGLLLRVYLAEPVAGRPRPRGAHDAVRWVPRAAVAQLAWVPADVPAVQAVVHRCAP